MPGASEGRMTSTNDKKVFPNLRVASMQPESGSISWESALSAKLIITRASDAAPVIQMENQASGNFFVQCILSSRTTWRAGAALFFVSPLPGSADGKLVAVKCPTKALADQLQAALEAALAGPHEAAAAGAPPPAHTDANGDPTRMAAAGVSCYPGRPNGDTATGRSSGPDSGSGWRPPPSPGPHLPPPSPGHGAAGTALGSRVANGSGRTSGAEDGSGAGPRAHDGPAVAAGPGRSLCMPPRSPLHSVGAVTGSPLHSQQQQQQQDHHRPTNGGDPAASGADGAAQAVDGAECGTNGVSAATAALLLNHFDRKICRASSDMYFHYYGMLQHQQNMLQDYTRTGTYYSAILGNPDDFRGRVVMDVGAGSGILSLFAAQAGASKVYAVEASGMARFARLLADANPSVGSRITVVNSKVEEVSLPERVDVLVSEPMGTLLVNERMLESYIFARDHFLKPGGKMFPQLGRIHAACFSDEVLHSEVAAKSAFWLQSSFYGVDVTSLHPAATEGYFGQVVVDAFDPSLLVTSCATRALDFGTLPEAELLDIDMPLELLTGSAAPVMIHGLACWFDVFFAGAQQPVWLTTAPGMPTTHWFQLRCVLQQPLLVTAPHTRITGRLHLVAHARQSYDIYLTLTMQSLQPGQPPQTSSGKFDLKEPYYRQLTSYGAAAAAATLAGTAAQAMGADGGVAAVATENVGWGWM
ncbi:hypothetical protein Vafri_18372 [Volvox africanus]|uniref:type I protein arginine methyltransferase n=1 Tax=Volvox africanus TaxID=51714 RepID=A0A8J4BLX7_9CHLO|nr:hypothetical protein Vafri_18372 [Volvox africanus]